MKNKKIIFVTTSSDSLINFRIELIKRLLLKNIDVHVVAGDFKSDAENFLKSIGVNVHKVSLTRSGINPFKEILSIFSLFKLFQIIKPDYVFSYFVKSAIYGSIAGFFCGVKNNISMIEGLGYFYTKKTNKSIKKSFIQLILNNLLRVCYFCSDKVLLLNDDDFNELIDKKIFFRKKCKVVGGIGVDIDRFSNIKQSSSGGIVFLMIGRILKEKGVYEFCYAAKSFLKRGNAKFILLGGLDDNPGAITKDEIMNLTEECGVSWMGHTKIDSWFTESTVFVLPSYREGVPVSTQEAMAAGLPVITTNAPGCKDTVVDGVNGFLVSVGDIKGLEKAMLRFLYDPSLLPVMGEESRRIAEDKFDVHKVNDHLLKIIIGD